VVWLPVGVSTSKLRLGGKSNPPGKAEKSSACPQQSNIRRKGQEGLPVNHHDIGAKAKQCEAELYVRKWVLTESKTLVYDKIAFQ